jgi:hypothetical protein
MTKDDLIALGNSHLEALKLAVDPNLLKARSSYFSIVPGATVVGLRNRNSLTRGQAFQGSAATPAAQCACPRASWRSGLRIRDVVARAEKRRDG